MQRGTVLSDEELSAVMDLIRAACAIDDAGNSGGLKGAVDRSTDQGKQLLLMLKDLMETSRVVRPLLDEIEEDSGS